MQNVREFLSELVVRSQKMMGYARQKAPPIQFEQAYTEWVESSLQVLTYAELHDYAQKIRSQHEDSPNSEHTIARITGWLQSAIACLEHGFVGRLRHVLRAEMFGSYVNQARVLQKAGLLIPAAVVGRVALEGWLRDQAEAAGITNHDTEKASKLNDALKAAGKLTQPKWRLIQSHLDVGNAAAHGKESEFADEDVTRLLAFVESNCLG